MTDTPKRKRGAQPGPRIPPAERTRPRSIALDDARWAKYRSLGTKWLKAKLDAE